MLPRKARKANLIWQQRSARVMQINEEKRLICAMYTIVLSNSEGFETDSVIYFTGGSKHLFPN